MLFFVVQSWIHIYFMYHRLISTIFLCEHFFSVCFATIPVLHVQNSMYILAVSACYLRFPKMDSKIVLRLYLEPLPVLFSKSSFRERFFLFHLWRSIVIFPTTLQLHSDMSSGMGLCPSHLFSIVKIMFGCRYRDFQFQGMLNIKYFQFNVYHVLKILKVVIILFLRLYHLLPFLIW